MPRPPKPYPHQGWWKTNYGGKQKQKLCREEEGFAAAQVLLAKLMLEHDQIKQESVVTGRAPGHERTVGDIVGEFLDLKKVDKAQRTYQFYVEKLAPLVERFQARPAKSITLHDAMKFKDWLMNEKPWMKGKTLMHGLGNTTVNHSIRCAKMLFRWAAKPTRRYVLLNPFEETTKLPEKVRERVITPEELQALIDECQPGRGPYHEDSDQDFRELLVVLRNSTMRPGELRAARYEYIHWDRNSIIIPADVVKTRNRRQVTMNDVMKVTLQGRMERTGVSHGYIFPGGRRKDVEKQMTDQALCRRFRRLFDRCVKKKTIQELKSGEKLRPYSSRHGRITDLVAARLPQSVVMDEAGHLTPAMTHKYTHIASEVRTDFVRAVPALQPSLPTASPSSGESAKKGRRKGRQRARRASP